MNQKIRKIMHFLFLPLLFAVLLVPKQVFAEGYSCTTTIPVELEVTGEKVPDGLEYRLVLEAVTKDAPMPSVTEMVIRNSGKGQFGPVTYTVPGDYQYKVYQEVGQEERVTYDPAVYTVTVRVVNDENGGLKSEIWAVKNDATEKYSIRFVNSYQAPANPPAESSGNVTPAQVPKTGDQSPVMLWVILACVSAAGLAVIAESKRRGKDRK